MASFSLMPFRPAASPTHIGGSVALCPACAAAEPAAAARLQLHYRLSGDLGGAAAAVKLPPAAQPPGRRDGLWQHTCLEAFIGIAGERGYWELNLSPGGHWAVYRFPDYRQGGREEPMAPSQPWAFDHDQHSLDLSVSWPLPAELAQARVAGQALELAIAAVIERQNGALEYWALQHPGPEPDFHRREGFGIRL